MSDDLVKRLREDQPVTQDMVSTVQCALQDAAADRIEELEAKLAKAVEFSIAARSAQKTYFKDRSKDNLIASKQAEASLDKLLAELKGEDRG